MQTIIKYEKKITQAEKIAINIIKQSKNTTIILQYNIEMIFIYKKKICKEKECKLTIKNANHKVKYAIKNSTNKLLIELKK